MAENGRIPLSELTAFDGALGTVWLRADAYRWWQAMAHAAAQDGVSLVVLEGYRDIDTQWELWNLYGYPRAGYPGTSPHGWAIAVDIANVGPFGSAKYNWLAANAARFGYSNAVGIAIDEPWHWVFEPVRVAGLTPTAFLVDVYRSFPRKRKTMIAYVLNDGAGRLGPVGKLHTYVIGAGYFEETTDHPTANAVSVLVNGYGFNDDGSPFLNKSPNLTYKELYAKAVASRACPSDLLERFQAAAA